jgi:hypothetical protein
MTKFRSVLFKYLPNAAHCHYFTNVSAALADSPPALLTILGTLPAEFNEKLVVEKALMDWTVKSYLTKEIVIADAGMNRALIALKSQVRTLQLSIVSDIANAALRTYIMLKDYGRVYRKPYDEKLGDIFSILRQFDDSYAADAAILGLAVYVSELQRAAAEFDRLLALRSSKSLNKPSEDFRTVRRSIEKIYHRITFLINAGAAVNASPAFAAFINGLNPEIERLNDEFHRVRRKMNHAQIEAIPAQTYTGEPLTPTPAVFCTTPHGETVKLQLGKDYNFTYRNNTKAGTAQCTVHGKGLYTGRRTVTFIIH